MKRKRLKALKSLRRERPAPGHLNHFAITTSRRSRPGRYGQTILDRLREPINKDGLEYTWLLHYAEKAGRSPAVASATTSRTVRRLFLRGLIELSTTQHPEWFSVEDRWIVAARKKNAAIAARPVITKELTNEMYQMMLVKTYSYKPLSPEEERALADSRAPQEQAESAKSARTCKGIIPGQVRAVRLRRNAVNRSQHGVK